MNNTAPSLTALQAVHARFLAVLEDALQLGEAEHDVFTELLTIKVAAMCAAKIVRDHREGRL